jgi:hypothetical protein
VVRRILGLATLVSLATACSTLSTLHGARTLEPHQTAVGFGISLQHASNPLGNVLPAFPQVELAVRWGLVPDVDVGFRAYLLGLGGDVRYRFYHDDRLDLAVAPGLDAFYFPSQGGSANLRAPLLGEVQLNRTFSLGGGPALMLRDQWNQVALGDAKGLTSRVDVYAGGGARIEAHGPYVAVGLSTDLYAQPARVAGLAWSAGVDLSFTHARRSKSHGHR